MTNKKQTQTQQNAREMQLSCTFQKEVKGGKK